MRLHQTDISRKGLLGLVVVMVSIISCTTEGEDIHLIHELPPFTAIEIDAVFEVEIVEDSIFQLEVTGRDDIAGKTTFRVENNTLYIGSRYKGQWLSPGTNRTKLVITANGLTRIFASETCHIKSRQTLHAYELELALGGKLNYANIDVDCHQLKYYNAGPTNGRVTLRGRAVHLQIYIGALMEVDARDLISDYATVATSSKLDVHVFVQRHLVYSIGNSGNILLWNEPEHITPDQITAGGKLIRL
jgi:hypothetical protein